MLDALIAVLLGLAALIAATGGVEVQVGAVTLRSHSVWRVLAVAVIPVLIRARQLVAARDAHAAAAWLTRMALTTLMVLGVGYWFKYLLTSVGGADSFGYASAARLLASGRLIDPAPVAEWLSAPNRLALATPLGWQPSAGGLGIVPAYPLGLPGLMALFTMAGGPDAIYFVSPVMGLLTLWLVFRLARMWADDTTALLATVLVTWNPVFLTYTKQPMSDVLATAWTLAAVCLALMRTGPLSAAGAGVAAGAAFLTRPATILAGAVVPLLALRGPTPWRRLVIAGIGVATAGLVQVSIQWHFFGNPLGTGYGTADALFTWPALPQNLDIYARQSWVALGGPWLVGLATGMWVMRGPRTNAVVAVATAVTLPYLFYIPFDHWETLRFLLPGIVPLSILVAAGAVRLAAGVRAPILSSLFLILFAGAFVARSERLMRESSVFDIQNIEARYPLAGQWVTVNTPLTSVVLADQHSGSLRWYSGRQTVRWDLLDAGALVQTVSDLEGHGATVYVALEGSEIQRFDAKFSAELSRLSVDPVGRIRNVSFLRLRLPR